MEDVVMPITKQNKKRYPANWKAIALSIKDESGWMCECCAKPCRRTAHGESWHEFMTRLEEHHETWYHAIASHGSKPQQFTLTVAHLDHVPENCDRSNLKAMCSVCHLQYDADHHAQSRKANPKP
jgi:hypothetical protein